MLYVLLRPTVFFSTDQECLNYFAVRMECFVNTLVSDRKSIFFKNFKNVIKFKRLDEFSPKNQYQTLYCNSPLPHQTAASYLPVYLNTSDLVIPQNIRNPIKSNRLENFRSDSMPKIFVLSFRSHLKIYSRQVLD